MADPNRALFESVVQLLRPVLDKLVFVGGCTTGLLITDPDGRAEVVGEIAEAEPGVRKYINTEIGALLKNEDFVEALSGYLLPNAASQARRPPARTEAQIYGERGGALIGAKHSLYFGPA